jgi:nucleotide-binding universal stress UspA family protein
LTSSMELLLANLFLQSSTSAHFERLKEDDHANYASPAYCRGNGQMGDRDGPYPIREVRRSPDDTARPAPTDPAGLCASVTAAGYAALIHALQDDADLREVKAKEVAAAVAAERGIGIALEPSAANGAKASFQAIAGDEDEVIRSCAAVNDLTIFPRISGKPGEALPALPLLKSALEYSGRPVLVVTDDLPKDVGTIVAIAWNGSTEGARAVTAALPILSRAAEVIVLTVATGKTKGEEGERLQKYLACHDVKSRVERLDQDASVGEELISGAVRLGTGLIVTGAYTHSRLRQTLFGGVTHHLLENCRLPMLMAH